MKTILQFALAKFVRLDMATLRQIWTLIENLVSNFEVAKFKGDTASGEQKLQLVVEQISKWIPINRREIGTQIIRAIAEIVLIGIRLKGGVR